VNKDGSNRAPFNLGVMIQTKSCNFNLKHLGRKNNKCETRTNVVTKIYKHVKTQLANR